MYTTYSVLKLTNYNIYVNLTFMMTTPIEYGAGPNEPQEHLDIRAGVEPNTAAGQHFLIDREIVDRTCDTIPEGAWCVEIGAGTGSLTAPILDRVGPSGKVIAYEIDERCLPVLRTLPHQERLDVRHTSFLDASIAEINSLEPFHLIGNVPYHILEPLLRQMIDLRFEQALIMMPERFINTITARQPGSMDWTRSSMIARAFFTIEKVVDAPKDAFDPPPPVDSAVMRITHNDADPVAMQDPIVKAYRMIAGTLQSDATVASVLKMVNVRPDGKVEGGGTKDHKRHRTARRAQNVGLRALAYEYNTTGSLRPESIRANTANDLYGQIVGQVGEKALNVPLVAMDRSTIRRLCGAIEGSINRRAKTAPQVLKRQSDGEDL